MAGTPGQGSRFWDDQIYYAVRYYRQVTVELSDGTCVRGYIYGGDDYHFGLIDSALTTYIFPKSTFLDLMIETRSEHPVIEDEQHSEEIKDMVSGFRHALIKRKNQSLAADSPSTT